MKEIINKRNKREKHFLNDDGTITAYIYNKDVHYLKNGKYVEIDNSFIEKDDFIVNKENDFIIKFKKNNYLINVTYNDNYLNMSLENSNDVKLSIVNNKVVYNDILKDIDMVYEIDEKKLKEFIILKSKPINSIKFTIDTDLKLEAKDNKIIALSENKVAYNFMPIVMLDKKENYTENCKYSLNKISDTSYEVELILNNEFLNNAVYPVVIDPTITTDEAENVFDTTIISDNPTHVGGLYQDYLTIGRTANRISRTLLKFVLPKINSGDNVIDASIYFTPHSVSIFQELKPIGIYELTSDWDEMTTNWSNMSENYNKDIESYFYSTTTLPGEDTNYSVANITNLFKKWITDHKNNGIMLKLVDETYDGQDYEYGFYSKTYDLFNETSYRPVLVVQYREQNGLLDYMTYENVPFTLGCAHVNNCTGNLTTQISLADVLEPNSLFNLNITYNTQDMNNKNNYFGMGFNITYNETITKIEDSQLIGDHYKYVSGNGEVHYFVKQDNSYIDEDGIGLSLEIVSDESKDYNITSKDKNKYIFKGGYLSKIEMADDNSISITRDDQNRIVNITDSRENQVNISYNVNKITISGKSKEIIINLVNNKISNIVTIEGITSFTYNTNELLSKIIDLTGLSASFDYYDESPFKVKKITQYGIHGETGKSKIFDYGFYTTTVTENNNIKYRYSFNNLGNTTSTIIVDKKDCLKNLYGFSENYVNTLGTPYTNKSLSESLPHSYSNNLLNNSSLEYDDDNCFFAYNKSNDEARTGLYSAKVIGNTYTEISCDLESNQLYTFSAYFKNKKRAKISLSLHGTNGSGVTNEYEILPNDEFTRYEITFSSSRYISALGINIYQDNEDVIYIDDLQLEEGNVANTYNMLRNGNFKESLNDWSISGVDETTGENINAPYELLTLDSNETVLKLDSIINGSVVLNKTIKTNGKKGDVFTLSFLYKNNGILDNSDMEGNFAVLNFDYPEDPDAEYNHGTYNIPLNYHSNEWQMFTETYVAEADFSAIYLSVLSVHEIKSIYVTNFSLVKDLGNYTYKYDENGNLISTKDVLNNEDTLKYDKNNQLISSFDAKGNNYKYEYDNIKTTRILKGISPTGISNEFKYDSFGNVCRTVISNVNPKGKEINGNYYIRLKGTEKYIAPDLQTNELFLKENSCSHYAFKIDKNTLADTTVYNLSSTVIPIYILSKIENSVKIIRNGVPANFELVSNSNGSYKIKLSNEDLYLKANEDKLVFSAVQDDPSFEFYFEDIDTNEFIETKSTYTADGKYIKEIIDPLNNKTIYNIDENKGVTNSIIDANGVETRYSYDDNNRLKTIEYDNKVIDYEYDGSALKTISTGNKKYDLDYDDFLNIKSVKLNNNELVAHEYDINNGMPKKVNYANGGILSYEYDDFNRISKLIKDKTNYYRYYDNFGLLSKVDKNYTTIENYYYDYAKRLTSYMYLNQYKIAYKYDENNNINHKSFCLLDDKRNINYEFNEDDCVVKINFDDTYTLNNEYDYLGRLKSKNINNKLPIEITYKKNGNKTSNIIDTIKVGNDTYQYFYDNVYNIISISKNGTKVKDNSYDDRRQLVSVIDYEKMKKYIYSYDNEGNILTKEEYNLENDRLITKDEFKYENANWEDQLTKFNDEYISYDAIGNPIKIGNKELTWQNGRELSSYVDSEKTIQYEYNSDGIRISKKIGNDRINYYLEGNKIIFEKKNNDVIYYMYDNVGSLLGFNYKNNVYYYLKNIQNDIVGIYDNNYNLIVQYEYDSWGKILNIIDSSIDKIGNINPFRYRSYYYDEETNLYYLNSRYYNPEWCRFINADGIIGANKDIISSNLYAYVSNSPETKEDSNGKFSFGLETIFAGEVLSALEAGLGVAGLAILGVTAVAVVSYTIYSAYQLSKERAAELADDLRKQSTNKNQKKDDRKKGKQAVYGLFDENDVIMYVGRTNDLERRREQHKKSARSELRFKPLSDYVSYPIARGLEELYIYGYGTLNKDNPLNNQIRGISLNNPYRNYYLDSAEQYFSTDRPVKSVIWDN